MATRIDVSEDLFIEYSEVGYVDIVNALNGRNAFVNAAELLPLIADLTKAAEGMGLETVQGELMGALKEIVKKLTPPNIQMDDEGWATWAHRVSDLALKQAERALAKAEQK